MALNLNRISPTILSVKWYLAGPMTGHKDSNYPAFAKATQALRAMGLDVVSPHETMENMDERLSWDECIRHDLRTLTTCTGIILLPGWSESRGANLEFQTALALGLTLAYFDDPILIPIR
jgi:hypothetical protein